MRIFRISHIRNVFRDGNRNLSVGRKKFKMAACTAMGLLIVVFPPKIVSSDNAHCFYNAGFCPSGQVIAMMYDEYLCWGTDVVVYHPDYDNSITVSYRVSNPAVCDFSSGGSVSQNAATLVSEQQYFVDIAGYASSFSNTCSGVMTPPANSLSRRVGIGCYEFNPAPPDPGCQIICSGNFIRNPTGECNCICGLDASSVDGCHYIDFNTCTVKEYVANYYTNVTQVCDESGNVSLNSVIDEGLETHSGDYGIPSYKYNLGNNVQCSDLTGKEIVVSKYYRGNEPPIGWNIFVDKAYAQMSEGNTYVGSFIVPNQMTVNVGTFQSNYQWYFNIDAADWSDPDMWWLTFNQFYLDKCPGDCILMAPPDIVPQSAMSNSIASNKFTKIWDDISRLLRILQNRILQVIRPIFEAFHQPFSPDELSG